MRFRCNICGNWVDTTINDMCEPCAHKNLVEYKPDTLANRLAYDARLLKEKKYLPEKPK